MLSYNADLSM